MYGHSSYGSNKYGGLAKATSLVIKILSKIPSILLTARDKSVVLFKRGNKHVLKTKNDKTIL